MAVVNKLIMFVCFLAIAEPAWAKCPYATYEVTGAVAEISGRPIPLAHIDVTWIEAGQERTASVRAASNGSFRAKFRSDTYSGEGWYLGGDECKAELDSVTVSVIGNGLSAQKRKIALKNHKGFINFVLQPTK